MHVSVLNVLELQNHIWNPGPIRIVIVRYFYFSPPIVLIHILYLSFLCVCPFGSESSLAIGFFHVLL